MTLFEIIILAIIQGVTEFLPISSSGHLLLPAELFGWVSQGLAFDVAVHVGSLLAVMIYFRQEIAQMTVAWVTQGFSKQQSTDSKLAWYVIVATIPAVIIGFLMKGWIERTYGAGNSGYHYYFWFAAMVRRCHCKTRTRARRIDT